MSGIYLFLSLNFIQPANATEIPVASSGHASNPVWSADGSKLAFEVNEYAGKIDLFAVFMDGTQYKEIKKVDAGLSSSGFGSSTGVNAAPIWQRNALIFEHSRKGVPNRIYFSDFIRPARPVIQMDLLSGDLSWSTLTSDGTSLYFVSDSQGSGDIFSYTFKGRILKPVVESNSYSEMAPTLNASGTLIYTRKHGNGEDIYTNSNGSSKKWVGGNGDQTRPIWANSNVVFFSNERGVDLWDVVSSSKPSAKKVLARNIRLPIRATPALSPDKQWVAYGTQDPEKSNAIWISKVDGSKTFAVQTSHIACGEPALTESNGRILLAYTALPAEGSAWRKLHVIDITDKF